MQSNMQKNLINWYNQSQRAFPWRQNCDPYLIWISEIMLQQTTTEAVIPYFERFIKIFPTVHQLAEASLEDVYKLWEGLGYYRRAKHIHETAQLIVSNYQGDFPTTYQDILSLKGIGPYTAGAICSIAYHLATPAVDGNVLRIIARQYLIKDNIALTRTHKQITKIVHDLLIGHDPSAFNQGLMDLGATICRPQNPKCDICPISSTCQAYHNQMQQVLPILIKKINHKDMHYITAVITYEDQFLLMKNPPGLLENLYGFIQYECESPYTFLELFEAEFSQALTIVAPIQDIKHIFTHRTWHMHVYHMTLKKPINHLYTFEDMQKQAISTAHTKVIKAYLNYKKS